MLLDDNAIDQESALYWCVFLQKSKKLNEGFMNQQMTAPAAPTAGELLKSKYGAIGDAFKEVASQELANTQSYAHAAGHLPFATDSADSSVMNFMSDMANDASYSSSLSQHSQVAQTLMQKYPELWLRTKGLFKGINDEQIYTATDKLMHGELGVDTPVAEEMLQHLPAGECHFDHDLVASLENSHGIIDRGLTILKHDANCAYNWTMFGKSHIGEMSKADRLDAFLMNGGKNIAIVIICAVVLWYLKGFITSHVVPRLKLAWKSIRQGKPLALTMFSNTEDQNFECFFDTKRNRWILAKVNGFFKSFITPSDELFADQQSTSQFFQTQFFNKFKDRCAQIIRPYLDMAEDDPRLGQFGRYLKNNRNEIENYMFAGKYAMFESRRI